MRLSVFLRIALVALTVHGCADPRARELLTQTSRPVAANAIAATHQIFVVTTRASAADRLEVYSGQRSFTPNLASVKVSIPAIHKTGQIEHRRGPVGDASKYFTATDVAAYNLPGFVKTVRDDIARHNGRALVFIHGYNTSFDSAVYRMTQIVHDAGYTGTPVLFSWASGGRTLDYVYDNNSATAARDGLEATLRGLKAAGAKEIDIIAHSMGNWVTMEALRQLAIAKDPDLGGSIRGVMLASPDIDVDVFKSQMARYGRPKKPFLILLSGDDKALRFSSLLAGDRPRVGDYSDASELSKLGVVVVDLTQVKGDPLNHTKFAENPVMIKLIGEGLKLDASTPQSETEVTDRINTLTGSLGKTLGSGVAIIITSPFKVARVVIGG